MTPATPATGVPTLLSVPEAAALARCSARHTYRLAASGEIEAWRVGFGHGPIRLPADSFRAWPYGEAHESRAVAAAMDGDDPASAGADGDPRIATRRRARPCSFG